MGRSPLLPPDDLERFRKYLSLLVRLQVGRRWGNRVDLSGVVQQTLLDAHRAWKQFQAFTDEEKTRWLRRALASNLVDEIRKLSAASRDVKREQSLRLLLDESSARLEAWLTSDGHSPVDGAIRNERLLYLAEALGSLPPDQMEAVELHHLNGLTLAETAEEMKRSKGAVAQLIFRGLQKLRLALADKERE
jgi:RNA polymerase sigma-70 factor (subfamily 1)